MRANRRTCNTRHSEREWFHSGDFAPYGEKTSLVPKLFIILRLSDRETFLRPFFNFAEKLSFLIGLSALSLPVTRLNGDKVEKAYVSSQPNSMRRTFVG
jgi:hypothetical protein